MRSFRTYFLVFAATLVASNSAFSATLPPIAIKHSVEGIEFSTPITIDIGEVSEKGLAYSVLVDLSRVPPTLNTLANRHAHGDISHKGSSVWAENGLLHVKVHLNYRVGGLIGSTNGSVIAIFQAIVDENSVRLSPLSTDIRISNDLVRIGADLTGFRNDLRRQIMQSLTDVLSADNALLALPPAVQKMGITLAAAHFDNKEGKVVAIFTGTMPKAAAAFFPNQ